MQFEYDENKNRTNLEKHGIDFEFIKALWDDPEALILDAKSTTEPRKMGIGKIQDKCYSVIFMIRGRNVRIISARPASKKERAFYENNSR